MPQGFIPRKIPYVRGSSTLEYVNIPIMYNIMRRVLCTIVIWLHDREKERLRHGIPNSRSVAGNKM